MLQEALHLLCGHPPAVSLLEQTGNSYSFHVVAGGSWLSVFVNTGGTLHPFFGTVDEFFDMHLPEFMKHPEFTELPRIRIHHISVSKLDPVDWAWFQHRAALENMEVCVWETSF